MEKRKSGINEQGSFDVTYKSWVYCSLWYIVKSTAPLPRKHHIYSIEFLSLKHWGNNFIKWCSRWITASNLGNKFVCYCSRRERNQDLTVPCSLPSTPFDALSVYSLLGQEKHFLWDIKYCWSVCYIRAVSQTPVFIVRANPFLQGTFLKYIFIYVRKYGFSSRSIHYCVVFRFPCDYNIKAIVFAFLDIETTRIKRKESDWLLLSSVFAKV